MAPRRGQRSRVRVREVPDEAPLASHFSSDDQVIVPGRLPVRDLDPSRAADVERFLLRSRKQWQTAEAATATQRQDWRTDQRFAAGHDQWATEEEALRNEQGRPCLTINRIPQFLRLVENQQRAARTQIQISPRAGGATKETAGALQGLIRAIEVESDADIAYDTACHHQLRIGFGAVRIRAEWADDATFEQIIRIKRIRNPLSLYWDPSIQEAIWDDARYLHIIAALGQDEYEAKYGRISPYQSLVEWDQHQSLGDWMPEGKVIVAEYYYTDLEERELLRLDSGDVVWETEFDRFEAAWKVDYPGAPVPAVNARRRVKKRVVRWALHNAIDILEGNKDRTAGKEIPGSRIPVFPVIGDEIDLDGVPEYRGMVRDGRDPQRLYNFWASNIAEVIALTPKAPWIAAAGQIEDYLEDWKDANRVAKAVLLYDPKTVEGELVPEPKRNIAEPPIQAMVQGLAQANNDLQAVMGLYEPSLGVARPEQSGKSVEAQQQQGVLANSNFLDNLARTKRAVGRALLQWIPVIYDTPRLVHLVKPDGGKQLAYVHAGADNRPGDDEIAPDQKIAGIFDLGVGQYEVTVSVSPMDGLTERQRTQNWLIELFKVLPGLAAVGADILLENSDDPSSQQLAKRAKLMLPPQVQDANDPEAALPIAQAQLGQIKQQFVLLQQAYAKALDIIRTKKVETSSREKIAIIQAQANLAAVAAKIGNQNDIAAFQAEFERHQQLLSAIDASIQAETDATNDAQLQMSSQAHDRAMAAEAHARSMAAAEQAHRHAMAQAAQGAGFEAASQAADHASTAVTQAGAQQHERDLTQLQHANTLDQIAATPTQTGGE